MPRALFSVVPIVWGKRTWVGSTGVGDLCAVQQAVAGGGRRSYSSCFIMKGSEHNLLANNPLLPALARRSSKAY